MKYPKIKSINIENERIDIFEGRTESFEKCAVAYFAGPEGWGVTMAIRLEELDCFLDKPDWQKRFIEFAKDKLGIPLE